MKHFRLRGSDLYELRSRLFDAGTVGGAMEFVDVLMSLFGYARVKGGDDQSARTDSRQKVVYEKRGGDYANSLKRNNSLGDAKHSVKAHLSYIFSNIWEALANVMRPTPIRPKQPKAPTSSPPPNSVPATQPINEKIETSTIQSTKKSSHWQTFEALKSFCKKHPEEKFNGTDDFKAWAEAEFLKSRDGNPEDLDGDSIIVLSWYVDGHSLIEQMKKKNSSAESVSGISTEEYDNDIDNKTPEKSSGQMKFENFLKDFESINNPDHDLNEGNPALDVDCYEYAEKIQSDILSLKNNNFSKEEKKNLGAAKSILSKYRLIQSQKADAAKLEQQRTERKAKEEARAALLAGQADFEEYLSNYKNAHSNEREITLYAVGKYFEPDVLRYADSQRDNKSCKNAVADLLKAAEIFKKWPLVAEDFQEPPPPPPPRAGAKPKEVPAAKPALILVEQRAAMRQLIGDIRDQIRLLSQNTDLTLGDIWFALEGLVAATENASDGIIAPESDFLKWELLVGLIRDNSKIANQNFYEVTDSKEKFEKALSLLDALQELSTAKGRAPNPALKNLTDAAKINLARDLILRVLKPTQPKIQGAYDFALKAMLDLSEEEAAQAQQQFDECVYAFKRHQSRGNPQDFFTGREGAGYLNMLCLSYAGHISEIYGKSSRLVEADQDAQMVAGFLLNEYTKRKEQAASFS